MPVLKWIVVAIALIQGGWLIFDGSRAIVIGDYVTPSTGPRAGQLGPWSKICSAAGFDPRGTLMKCVHVLLGATWLIALLAFAFRPALGWWVIFACAIGSLWYVPIGTLLSVVTLVLLLLPQLRNVN